MQNPILNEMRAFPLDSAGGLMTLSFVAIAPDVRADQAIAGFRRIHEQFTSISYVYVLDQHERLEGVLPLHELVFSPPEQLIRDFMVADPIRVRAHASAESAARLLRDRNRWLCRLLMNSIDCSDHCRRRGRSTVGIRRRG